MPPEPERGFPDPDDATTTASQRSLAPSVVRTIPEPTLEERGIVSANPPPPERASEAAAPTSARVLGSTLVMPASLVALVLLPSTRGGNAASSSAILVGALASSMILEARDEARIVGPRALVPGLLGGVAVVACYLLSLHPLLPTLTSFHIVVPLTIAAQIAVAVHLRPAAPPPAPLTLTATPIDYRGAAESRIDREAVQAGAVRFAIVRGTLAIVAAGLVMLVSFALGSEERLATAAMGALAVCAVLRFPGRADADDGRVRETRWVWAVGLSGCVMFAVTRLDWRSALGALPMVILAAVWALLVRRRRVAVAAEE